MRLSDAARIIAFVTRLYETPHAEPTWPKSASSVRWSKWPGFCAADLRPRLGDERRTFGSRTWPGVVRVARVLDDGRDRRVGLDDLVGDDETEVDPGDRPPGTQCHELNAGVVVALRRRGRSSLCGERGLESVAPIRELHAQVTRERARDGQGVGPVCRAGRDADEVTLGIKRVDCDTCDGAVARYACGGRACRVPARTGEVLEHDSRHGAVRRARRLRWRDDDETRHDNGHAREARYRRTDPPPRCGSGMVAQRHRVSPIVGSYRDSDRAPARLA